MELYVKKGGSTMLPQDPAILLSVVNARLRDQYPDLDELCQSEGVDRAALEEKLAALDYRYDGEQNQFI